jgi:hypothetical protein
MLTQEKLKELLDYDPETGIFRWKFKPSKQYPFKIGDIAGTLNSNGYIRIQVLGSRYKAHRLAWLYVYGYFPSNMIDHINRNPNDNRISNLREATSSQNQMNTIKRVTNTSGYKGVCWDKREKKWRAQTRANNKVVTVGYFKNIEDASIAYQNASIKYHGNFSNSPCLT